MEEQTIDYIQLLKQKSLLEIELFIQNFLFFPNQQLLPNQQIFLFKIAAELEDYKCLEILKLVQKYGNNLDIKNSNCQTIMFYLAKNGNNKCIQWLISQGLKFNAVDIFGMTPIFIAASENQIQTIKRFALKDDINISDKLGGQTALFYAVAKDHFQMFKLLLQMGANINHIDYFRRNLLYYAMQNQSKQIRNYIFECNRFNLLLERPQNKIEKDKKVHLKLMKIKNGQELDITKSDKDKVDKIMHSLFKNNDDFLISKDLKLNIHENWQVVAFNIICQATKLKQAAHFIYQYDDLLDEKNAYTIISSEQQINLNLIKNKLEHHLYKQPYQFLEDSFLISKNALQRFGQKHQLTQDAELIVEFITEKCRIWQFNRFLK